MKHGYDCKCPACAIGRTIGMIKKPSSDAAGHVEKKEDDCCGSDHEHDGCCKH